MVASKPGESAVLSALAQICLALVLGLVALPLLLGDPSAVPAAGRAPAWLGGAMLLSFWLILVSLPLARLAAAYLTGLDAGRASGGARRPLGPIRARSLAAWAQTTICFGLVQAMLHRPTVAVVAGPLGVYSAELCFAVATIVVTLACLVGLYRAGRAVFEGATWSVLDAFALTTEPAARDRAGETATSVDTAAGLTVGASGAKLAADIAATRASLESAEATKLAGGDDATRLGGNVIGGPSAASGPSAAPAVRVAFAPGEFDSTLAASPDVVDATAAEPDSTRRAGAD